MKTTTIVFILASLAFGQSSPTAAKLSPAEQSMAAANRLIAKNGKDFEAYNALALALSRRARETSDVNFYKQAEDALKRSFEISPDNFDGDRTAVWLLLGKHEFPAALEKAKELNKKMPDDVMIYGFLTDANVELGNYDAAEKAAQWMLNLRPGNMPGITRAAYLRELFGDIDGSLELMNMAYQSTPPGETEDRAWILSQIGHLQLTSGKISEAENTLEQALAIFPRYHYALQNLAKVRIEQKRYTDAVTLLQQRYDDAHHAENLYDLAEAEKLAGRTGEAKRDFADFEIKSLAESVKKDNSSRELVFYYADQAHEPAKALNIAEQEFAWRHDVFTLDAYAWALHVNGRDSEARKHIESALAVGIRDAKMLRHAGEIAMALGDRAAGERYLRESAELNAPGSSDAIVALLFAACSIARTQSAESKNSTATSAAEEYSLRGKVVAANGAEVSGAEVRLANTRATTDAHGNFKLQATGGSQQISISADGYAPLTIPISVTQDVDLKFEMQPAAVVMVTAQSDDSARYSTEQIHDVADLIQSSVGQPGVPVRLSGLPAETASGGVKAPQYFASGVAGDHGEPIAQYIQVGE